MTYARHAILVDVARTRPAIWRLLAGVVTTFVVLALWSAGLVFLLSLVWQTTMSDAGFRLVGLPPDIPSRAIFYLLIISGMGVGTLVAARLWQKRGARSLVGSGATTLRHFAIAAGTTFIVVAAVALLPPWSFDEYDPNLPISTWLAWLPFALIAIVAQTGAEEVFFRGYLQSQLAARFRHRAVWIFVPALVFGMAHFVPYVPTQNAVVYVTAAFIFGLLAADLTARTGSLGAAWGFHFANNALALLVVSTEGTVTGLSLYRSRESLAEPLALSPGILVDLFAIILTWVLIRRAVRV